MNAQIERDFEFQAAVFFQNTFLLNYYSFTLCMDVNTESVREQNVAMDRIKYFITDILENCVFVEETENKQIEKFKNAGIHVCITPEEPYDQIIALLILLKLNAICENRIKVTNIKLTSKLSDEVNFKETIETAQITYPLDDWYNQSYPEIVKVNKQKNKKEKVVKLTNDEWNDIGLYWKEKKDVATEIFFTIDPEK